jgi:hypothetical protein
VDLQHEDPELFSLYLRCVYFGAKGIHVDFDGDASGNDCQDPKSGDQEMQDERDGKENEGEVLEDRDPSEEGEESGDEEMDDGNSGDENEDEEPEHDGHDDQSEPQPEEKVKRPGRDTFKRTLSPQDYFYDDEHEKVLRENDAVDNQMESLAKLCILADKLRDQTITNTVIDELARLCNEHESVPKHRTVILVYESTVHGSPLRRFLRDAYLNECASDTYVTFHWVDLPVDFYRDLYVEFLRIKDANASRSVDTVYKRRVMPPAGGWTLVSKCHYHQHGDDDRSLYPPAREITLKFGAKKKTAERYVFWVDTSLASDYEDQTTMAGTIMASDAGAERECWLKA